MCILVARRLVAWKQLVRIAGLAGLSLATITNVDGQAEPSGEQVIAATVANQVVIAQDADGLLRRTVGDRTLSEDVKCLLQAKSLEQLVGQLLVMEYLRA